jgi:hypothetical protein
VRHPQFVFFLRVRHCKVVRPVQAVVVEENPTLVFSRGKLAGFAFPGLQAPTINQLAGCFAFRGALKHEFELDATTAT